MKQLNCHQNILFKNKVAFDADFKSYGIRKTKTKTDMLPFNR